MIPPRPEELGTLPPIDPELPADPTEQLAVLVVQMSYLLQRMLVVKRWDKTTAAQELAIMTELLKTRYPSQFPPGP